MPTAAEIEKLNHLKARARSSVADLCQRLGVLEVSNLCGVSASTIHNFCYNQDPIRTAPGHGRKWSGLKALSLSVYKYEVFASQIRGTCANATCLCHTDYGRRRPELWRTTSTTGTTCARVLRERDKTRRSYRQRTPETSAKVFVRQCVTNAKRTKKSVPSNCEQQRMMREATQKFSETERRCEVSGLATSADTKRLVLDHCHETHKVRGWLTDDVNVIEGRIRKVCKDSGLTFTDVLDRLRDYEEKYK